MKYIDKSALVAEIEKLIDEIYAGRPFDSLSSEQQTALWYVKSIMSSVNTLKVKEWKEEPVNEDLEEAITTKFNELVGGHGEFDKVYIEGVAKAVAIECGFAGAKWQKEHLWKPADGDDLPDIDREVVALLDNGKVVFAHRPNPEGWDGKSLTSGKVEHYTPKTYDKGGWNIPNVKYWLDCLMPKEIKL